MRGHAQAVEDILSAVPNLTVYDGEVPNGATGRYVVFYLTTPQGVERSRRVSADSPKRRFTLSTMYVGDTPNECRWVAEKVHDALLRQRLTVAGWVNDPFLPPTTSAQVRKDDSTSPVAWIATDVWQFNASPAPQPI
jgi:hypothetical protein